MYHKVCPKCGLVNTYPYYEDFQKKKELCIRCKRELPKEEKKKVFTMIDSAKIFRG